MGNVPRKTIYTDPTDELWNRIDTLYSMVESMQRASTLRSASVSGGTGIRMLDETVVDQQDPKLRIWMNPEEGTITAYDVVTGDPVVRMGAMLETGGSAEPYGIEVFVDNQWVQLGTQSVTWSQVSGKPATFPAGPHSHAGGDITSAVSNAVNATNATNATNAANATNAGHANLADGSQYAFNNTVSGSTFYAVWVGNDGGYHLGRNVSSIRYKENVRVMPLNKEVLKVEPVLFDRKPRLIPPPNGAVGPSNLVSCHNEYGVIAEQSHQHFPEATNFYDGKIDGIRYELYGAALIPIVREHDSRLDELEEQVRKQQALIERLLNEKGEST